MSLLLARLPRPACESLVRGFLDLGPDRWPGFDPANLPSSTRFAATGGTPVGTVRLGELRADLEKLARAHGFGCASNPNSLASFDAEAAAWLAQVDLFSTGEALNDEVWSFVSAVVAPDIVHWRFGTAIERYIGGIRNTFQRLWMRSRALDRGSDHPERWQLLTELTEDALVQITERPSIGGDSVLSLGVAEAWLRASRIHGRSRMEDIMRRAILGIRIRNEIRSLSELPEGRLAGFLDEMFGVSSHPRSRDAASAAIGQDTKAPPTGGMVDPNQILSLHNELRVCSVSLDESIQSILTEGDRCGWLSPISRAALSALSSGRPGISQSERNALDYLLERISGAGILSDEVELVRSVVSNVLRSSSETERPRKRSWAIWRAR